MSLLFLIFAAIILDYNRYIVHSFFTSKLTPSSTLHCTALTQVRAIKKPRLVWTKELHRRFVDAVNHLGVDKAVPKTIMHLMNVDGLTRENVASHLCVALFTISVVSFLSTVIFLFFFLVQAAAKGSPCLEGLS